MKKLATLAIALALLFPSLASGTPKPQRTNLLDNGFEYHIPFIKDDTDDSKAMRVRGMCSVTWIRGGSDVVELYSIPESATATSSGTLLATFTTTTTAATTFQSGTMWVKAVATTAATGGSIMRIHCSNSQVASTGEACTTAGLVPYVGDLGGYKCDVDYSYAEDDNELNVGALLVDAVANKNVISMEANSGYTGPNPSATQVLMYPLLDAVEPGYVVETLDSLDVPSRVVIRSPDYYDMVLSWGVDFTDILNEYADTSPGPGTPVVQNFCMVKAAHTEQAKAYDSFGQSGDVVVPLTGANGCTAVSQSTKPGRAYALMGDPWVKDVWCVTNTNLGGGGGVWATGDEIVVSFGVSNEVDIASAEYLVSIHDMAYGYDELVVYKEFPPQKNTELRDTVGAYASSVFESGSLDPGAIEMAIFTATIIGMTEASGSDWNGIKLQCSMGILFKDTR